MEDAYVAELAHGVAVDGVLAVMGDYWWHRHTIDPVWKLLESWKRREPVELRRPIAPLVLKAAIALAMAWQWCFIGLALFLGFHARF